MKILDWARKNVRYAMILAAGILTGGLSMNIAHASIPDSNGTIHGCRNNTTTMLRVVDSASQSCDGNESNLNWSQMGVEGYAHVTYDGGTDTYSLDTNRSKNISNVYMASDDYSVCMTVDTTPHTLSVAAEYNANYAHPSFKDGNGWTYSSLCDSYGSGANILVNLESPASFDVVVY